MKSTSRARRAPALVAGVFLALQLTSCTESAPPGSSAPQTTAPSPSPDQGKQMTNATAESHQLVGDHVSMPWQITDSTGRTLAVTVNEAGCAEFDRFAVKESDRDVLIAAIAKPVDEDQEMCPAIETSVPTTVTLEAPLGGRTLVHVPLTSNWIAGKTTP